MAAERHIGLRLQHLLDRLRASEVTIGILLAAVVGLCAGLGAVAFREMIKGFQWIFFNRGADILDFLGDRYVVLLPIIGALLFGPLIYFLAREAKGEGPPEVMEAIEVGGGRIRSRVAAVKALASSICIGSGGSVGREGPIVQIGASVGSTFGQWFRLPEGWTKTLVLCGITAQSVAETSGSYALVGMGAFFAATVHGPITAILLLFEMTRNYALILPLMTAVVMSTLVARSLSRESIYSLRLVRRGIDIHRREAADLLGGVKVSEVMTRDFPRVLPSMPLSQLINELHESGHHGFPMVDESGSFVGVVTLEDVESALSRGDVDLVAADVATRSPIVAYPNQSIHDAVAQLGGRDVGRIPVVDRSNPKRLLGVLRRHDIVRAYTRALGNPRAS